MKRFFAKVGRFFWSWGCLKFVLWTVTLIVLFYVEEDWRGARAWAATKAEWEAKGESFDLNKLIPPPVPDDQNLAAIPLFKMEPAKDDKGNSDLEPVALRRAMRTGPPNYELPSRGDWMRGELPDMAKIKNAIAADYSAAFKGATPPGDTLAQFDARYPFLTDFLAESANHPLCRFNPDYTTFLTGGGTRWLLIDQIPLSYFLTLQAILALDQHQSDLALEDIKTNFKLLSSLREQPLLVSGLCAIGVASANFSAVYDGLALHAWNDTQLADLEKELAKIDFLSDYQHDLRGEAIGVVIPSWDDFKGHSSRFATALKRSSEAGSKSGNQDFFPDFWADGWFDLVKAQAVTFDLNAVGFVDPKARLVFPKTVDQFAAEIAQRRHGWSAHTLSGIFTSEAAGFIAFQVEKFSRMQVWVDEARIASALERYRLAHNAYPDSLDALVPACIDEVPHDIMNGQPYHYRLRPDGTYLLYSVGWNQTDDGGKVVYKKDAPAQVDYKEGDWVWPTPQAAPAK